MVHRTAFQQWLDTTKSPQHVVSEEKQTEYVLFPRLLDLKLDLLADLQAAHVIDIDTIPDEAGDDYLLEFANGQLEKFRSVLKMNGFKVNTDLGFEIWSKPLT